MVLSLTADELVQAHFEALVAEGERKQVGLVIGRCGSKRDLAVAVIPTPAVAGAEPVRLSKGSAPSASSPSASVSSDAVAEHARQAALLLPGGLSVVGLFLLAPGGLAAGEATLLSAWREAVRSGAGSCRLSGSSGVLLGADASRRGRVSAREVVASPSPSSTPLRHAEIRFAPVLSKLVSLRATYPVAAKIVGVSRKKQRTIERGRPAAPPLLSDWLAAAAKTEAARARRAVALGRARDRPRPLDLSATVAASLGEFGEPEASSSSGAREVVLLPPAVSCSPLVDDESSDGDESDESDESESEETDDAGYSSPGTLRLQGWVEARAVVHERDSVGEAMECLALDVGETVRARVAAAVEEEEEEAAAASEEAEENESDKSSVPPLLLLSPPPRNSPVVVPLARRILFPLLPGGGGGSSAPAALVLGGDLAAPREKKNDETEIDRADGEGALDAAAQLCGRDDLTAEDLVFAEGRAEGTSAATGAASLSLLSPLSAPQQPRRETAAAPFAATAMRANAVPPLAAAGAVAVTTLALALGVYLTLA